LAEFQSKLVRLLSSDSLVESGLYLAQLPKEYEKSYQEKVPIPKDYGYRKLIQLLQNECPNICGYGYQTSLLIPCDDLVSYWLEMTADERSGIILIRIAAPTIRGCRRRSLTRQWKICGRDDRHQV